MARNYPYVLKNLRTHFANAWIRHVKKSSSYCTQKNPEAFSEEIDTATSVRVLHAIRNGVDTILFTGGEPLIRPDIVELVRAAWRDARFRDVLLVTNGVLLDSRRELLVVAKVLANLQMARAVLPSRAITISCVLEEWNIGEAERLLEYCIEHGFVFSVQSAQNGLHPNFALLHNPRYRAFVDKVVELRTERRAAINGTPKLLRTLLEFQEFTCYPTMFPRGLSQWRRLLSLRAAAEDRRKPARRRQFC